MRRVELVPGVGSSILGFGCAPILGAVGAKTAERALGTAWDEGVTHFDVARSYGYGEAEKFLGRFCRGRREQVVIASKFGIRATWQAQVARPLKPIVRWWRGRRAPAAASTGVAASVRRDPFHRRIAITAANMVQNLEESLRALRTEYLDFYLVHEPREAVQEAGELVECADRLKREGKIRGFGLAFEWDKRTELGELAGCVDIWQFGCSPGQADYEAMRSVRGQESNVLFSSLRMRGERTVEAVFGQLWTDFPRSVVLCSMFDPAHIRANVRVASSA
jgi:aryl-alcohol dehydrogenase-like predicted oxidoreductase